MWSATARGGWRSKASSVPVCGDPIRSTPDVIDELGEAVVDEGGSVRTVRVETKLDELLTACTLRFELPGRGRGEKGRSSHQE